MNDQIARFGVGQNDTKTLTEQECFKREKRIAERTLGASIFSFVIGAMAGGVLAASVVRPARY